MKWYFPGLIGGVAVATATTAGAARYSYTNYSPFVVADQGRYDACIAKSLEEFGYDDACDPDYWGFPRGIDFWIDFEDTAAELLPGSMVSFRVEGGVEYDITITDVATGAVKLSGSGDPDNPAPGDPVQDVGDLGSADYIFADFVVARNGSISSWDLYIDGADPWDLWSLGTIRSFVPDRADVGDPEFSVPYVFLAPGIWELDGRPIPTAVPLPAAGLLLAGGLGLLGAARARRR